MHILSEICEIVWECYSSTIRVGFLWHKAECFCCVPIGGMKGVMESAKGELEVGI